MKIAKQVQMLGVFVAFSSVLLYSSNIKAQVVDFQSFFQSIKDTITQIKESKTVVDTLSKAKQMSAAIGTAKKTITETTQIYKDKVEKNIKKAQDYVEKAKEYKAEYEKYRAEIDSAINKAKDLKKEVEDKAQSIKDKAQSIKDKAVDIQDKAQGSKDKAINIPDKETNTKKQTEDVKKEDAEGYVSIEKPTTPTRKPFDNQKTSSSDGIKNEALDNSVSVEKTIATPHKLLDGQQTSSFDIKEETVDEKQSAASENSVPKSNIIPSEVQIDVDMNKETIRTPTRKSFSTSQLNCSEKLAFAKIDAMPDGGSDANGTFFINKDLAMFCGINSADVQKEGVMDECLLRLNKERYAAQSENVYDAPAIYKQTLAKIASSCIAEAFKALNDAESFEEKVVEPIDFASEPTVQDVYSNIVEMNKAVNAQINNLMKIYSSQVLLKSVENYGNYLFLPPEEENADES